MQASFTVFLLCHMFLVVTPRARSSVADGILRSPFSVFALPARPCPRSLVLQRLHHAALRHRALQAHAAVPFLDARDARVPREQRRAGRRDRRADKPAKAAYGVALAWDQLVLVMAMTYAALAPATPLFGAAYFTISTLASRAQLGFAQSARAQSNGRFWRAAVPQALSALVLRLVVLIGVAALRGGFLQSLALAPLIAVTASQRARRAAPRRGGRGGRRPGDTFARHGGLVMPLDVAAARRRARADGRGWLEDLVDVDCAWAPPLSLPRDATDADQLLGVPAPVDAAAKHFTPARAERQGADDTGRARRGRTSRRRRRVARRGPARQARAGPAARDTRYEDPPRVRG